MSVRPKPTRWVARLGFGAAVPHDGPGGPVIDVGAGASTLVDGMLERGFSDVSLLDVAGAAFEATRARLGARANSVHYIVADVTAWMPSRFRLWHDRAAFHFLTEEPQRAAIRLRRGGTPSSASA